MKKYRLKESVKNYFDSYLHDIEMPLEEWDEIRITQEALEPFTYEYLRRDNGEGFTEQEVDDLKEFLVTFGSMDTLNNMAINWCEYNIEHKEKLNFFKWIKEIHEDKE